MVTLTGKILRLPLGVRRKHWLHRNAGVSPRKYGNDYGTVFKFDCLQWAQTGCPNRFPPTRYLLNLNALHGNGFARC